MATNSGQFAIVAGSGFKAFGGENHGSVVETAFGVPSGPVRSVRYGDHDVYMLARHGDDLLIPPHAINYRANMSALKDLGVSKIISINTVGVINDRVRPGQLAVPDQLLDYTWGRGHSIYEGVGKIDHIDFTRPFSGTLRRSIIEAAVRADIVVRSGGVYATMQGPRLETAAEVDRLERDGADYVGMTAMPEAALARELGMEYACLSLVVNFAAGRGKKSIHADLDASTLTAKTRAMKVLQEFFMAAADD